MDPKKRFSSYKTLPGKIPVLTKPADYIVTVKFQYSNQFSTSRLEVPHNLGRNNLIIAWAVDADEETKSGNLNSFNTRGTVHPLPHTRYVFDDDGGFPPVFFAVEYDNYVIYNYKDHFYIVNDALSGPIGNIQQDYVRIAVFNDSFDAPFIKPEES
jgi:hypothetical protein